VKALFLVLNMVYIHIFEKNELERVNTSITINVDDIVMMKVSFPSDDEDTRSLEIRLKGGEEPLTFGEHPTLLRMSDDNEIISETQDIRKFEYEYMTYMSNGFKIKREAS